MTEIYGNANDLSCFEQTSFITKKTTKLTDYQKQFLHLYDGNLMLYPEVGTTYTLVYSGETNSHYLFDGGYKDYVRVDKRQTEMKYLSDINVGDTMDVLIYEILDDPFMIHGSVYMIYETRIQNELTNMEDDEFILGLIKDSTPAGYTVNFNLHGISLVGFMPNTLAGINKLSDPDSIVGQTLELGVESYSKDEGTYIVSRRKYLQSLIPNEIKKLETGKIYRGVVTGSTDFGVFVEWNECLTGMIHKTNLNPEYNMSDIHPGIQIEFFIKEVIKDKIILTQVLKDSLWDVIKNGMILNGKVRDIKPFGALVILDEETQGLIHTSELEKMEKRPSINDEIEVKVIAIDRMNRKIFLRQNS
jgi:ribosomal protein S1